MMLSEQSSQSKDVVKRYADKIALCEKIDPYSIDINEKLVFGNLPKIIYLDIWNYLIMCKSAYSLEEQNAHKGLEGHKFFESGWVRKIVAKQIPNDKTIVVGIVEHSQRINETVLKPWVLCHQSGMIVAAHCTCIAGLGEVCSHVAAVLYAVESMIRSYENESKTDFLCQWNRPSTSTIDRFVPLAEMFFAKKERVVQDRVQLSEFDKDEIFNWLKENKENTNVASPLILVTPGLNLEFKKPHTERNKPDVSLNVLLNLYKTITVKVTNNDDEKISRFFA